LTYVPKGLYPGIFISLGSIGILGGYYWLLKKTSE